MKRGNPRWQTFYEESLSIRISAEYKVLDTRVLEEGKISGLKMCK